MKILIATGIFIPEIGGPATYIAKLSEQLLSLGHEVMVVTYSNQEYPEIDNNLKYKVCRIIRHNKLSNYWRYYKKLKELNNYAIYNLFYCFDHFSAGFPAVLANHKFKLPLFIRVGGDFIWERYLDQGKDLVTLRQFYQKGLHKSAEKFRFKIIKWIFRRADKIIFTTKFQGNIFSKYYKLPINKLALIKNPIDKISIKLDNQSDSKEIVFAGRFINKNNIKNLIYAFDKVKDQQLTLRLIGAGPMEARLAVLIKKYRNIYLEPKLSGQALIDRLTRAYLVVFPAVTDISPNTMLECLSLGIPFISSQEIGFDWLKDKLITFDPLRPEEITKAIDKLTNQEVYQNYADKLKQIEYNYTYAQAAEDTLALLKNESR